MDSATQGPVRIHCFFRSEMEHLPERAGFELQALYGDLSRGGLTRESTEMTWGALRSSQSTASDRRAQAMA
jgi:hypothetical protein